jgi:hypothetical protein
MDIICREEISKLRKLEESEAGGGQGAQQRGSVNASVADDVAAIFKGKTVSCSSPPTSLPSLTPTNSLLPSFQFQQLRVLEKQINDKVHSSDAGTDVGYWESLLQQLKAFMARVSGCDSP